MRPDQGKSRQEKPGWKEPGLLLAGDLRRLAAMAGLFRSGLLFLLIFMLVFLFCLNSLAALPGTDHAAAVELNERGFTLYSEQQFADALPLFEAAVEADSSYVYGWYNYACTAAILIQRDPERREELAPKAFNALERSVRLRSSYRDKMLSDPDLTALQDEYRFYRIAGFDPSGMQDARYLLQNLRWKAMGSSVWTGMDFYSDGTLALHSAEADITGTYRVADGGRIRIDVPDAGFSFKPVEGIIGTNGIMAFSLPGLLFVSGVQAAVPPAGD